MLNRISFRAFSVLFAFTVSFAALADDFAGNANAILAKAIEEDKLVGLSAAVSRDGVIIWSGAAGFADLENKVPATASTVHRIASISKAMTATAAMRLVEQGKLSLDEPIQTYVPYFPKKEWTFTAQNLLSHTSGIPHYFKPGQNVTMTHYADFEAAVGEFAEAPLKFEPGLKFQYTTFGYTLLGAAIEKASAKPFADCMRELVWDPAGMKSTRLEIAGEIVEHRARGYARKPDGTIVNAPYTDLSVKYPGGGILSTAEDLLRFEAAFEQGKLVSPETVKRMLSPTALKDGGKSNYGQGWMTGELKPFGSFFHHDGNQAGASSDLTAFPDKHIAVAAISNVYRTNPALTKIVRSLAALAIGIDPESVKGDAAPSE